MLEALLAKLYDNIFDREQHAIVADWYEEFGTTLDAGLHGAIHRAIARGDIELFHDRRSGFEFHSYDIFISPELVFDDEPPRRSFTINKEHVAEIVKREPMPDIDRAYLEMLLGKPNHRRCSCSSPRRVITYLVGELAEGRLRLETTTRNVGATK